MLPKVTQFGFVPKSRRQSGFVLDTSAVMRNMLLLNRVVMPKRIKRGLMLAGSRFMTDVVIANPTTPIRRPDYTTLLRRAGELRASGALFVDGVKKGTTFNYGEAATGKYQPVKYGGTPIPPMSHEACVVFNAPYAAKQHEEFGTKTEPTAGMYFMSTKLYGNGVMYVGIIARAIRL